MRLPRSTALLAVLVFTTVARADVDLAKIQRTVSKEPVYRSKPKYCLLVFGPQAKTRVWLVHDGERLYVDRNGNGDLTEPGESVLADKREFTNVQKGAFYFAAGAIRDGTLLHKDLCLWVSRLDRFVGSDRDHEVKACLALDPEARTYQLALDVQIPGRTGAGLDGRVMHSVSGRDLGGFLRFGNSPHEAPIIHFAGPLQITLETRPKLTMGRVGDLSARVGTPGLGAGTMAFLAYEGVIPADAYPKIEITYPTKRTEGPPVKELYELKDRC
jgi:hypothetical protein